MNIKRALRLAFLFQELPNRQQYFCIGTILMLFKYLVEFIFWKIVFGLTLSPIDFVNPLLATRWSDLPLQGPQNLTHDSLSSFFIIYLIWTLPFVWVGFSMSLRRLIDAGRAPWTAFLFFIPGLNWLLMFVLSLLPTAPQPRQWTEEDRETLGFSISESLKALILCSIFCVAIIAIIVYLFSAYSGALFVGIPFIYGFSLAMMINFHGVRPKMQTFVALILSELLAAGLLFLFAMEGAICLLMAAPIFMVLSIFGMFAGHYTSKRWRPGRQSNALSLFLLPLIVHPIMLPSENISSGKVHEVLSQIEIKKPPQQVWKHVVEFSQLAEPTDLIFKLGIAYPIRAEIEDSGVGAIRYCKFSTGDFVEPITEWNEPNLLSFDVRFQPKPMKELSIYDQVHAPHLDNFIQSNRGQFKLIELPGGRTRLEGRTWYQLNIHPISYWEIFSDYFIHRIHLRVLEHIRDEVERTYETGK